MAKYVVTKDRAAFIQENFIEWSFDKEDDYQPDKKLFEKLNHPAELYVLAYYYNWDDGPVVLEWILESPLCTRATANLLFWRAAPDYYLDFDINDENSCPEYNRAGFKVIRKVLDRYNANNFCPEEIEFNPKDEIEEIRNKNPKWQIPKSVYDKIKGLKVFIEHD